MAFSQRQLRNAGRGITINASRTKSASAGQTAFLCHSHADRDLVAGLQETLRLAGWDIYIDWQDTTMPESPNRQTAERIQNKIVTTTWFFFLATQRSCASRWCPWEIGYADGVKQQDRILIFPTSDDQGNWYGNEYLQLYRKVDYGTDSRIGAFYPQASTGTVVGAL